MQFCLNNRRVSTTAPARTCSNRGCLRWQIHNEAPEYCRGRWVKDCDKDIIRDLKQRGLLFHQEQYIHDYPFCPRAEEDALIQYPRQSWFIRTSQFKDDMLANNAKINWLPEHIKTGRFGKFLETNVDWALSRERYWGTPLPIWKCQATGQMEAVGSYDELMAKPGVRGGEVWDEAKTAKSQPARRPAHPQTVHRRNRLRLAVRRRCRHAPRAGGHRLLVRRRLDAVCPMGLSWHRRPASSETASSARILSATHQRGLDQTRGWF